MTAEAILTGLLRVNAVAGAAIVLVLLLRPWVLHWLGARLAYWLWIVVPIAVVASVLPGRERIVVVPPPVIVAALKEHAEIDLAAPSASPETFAAIAETPFVSLPPLAEVLIAVWLLVAAAQLARSIVSSRRLAADPSVGPALVGVLRPKLVLPVDFEARFNAQERALILMHEQVHRVSGHTVVNAVVEFARCASWFNPFVHLAALRLRADQELACDAAVIAARPTARRAYAEALLKTQVAAAFLPLGCTWTSPSAKRIGERIAMLGRPSLSRRGAIGGAAAVAIVGAASGYAAWAQQPERLVTETAPRPVAVWTPAADAPAGTLSHALEGQRHDFFIELAQKGDIDVVFFGTTATEMWWWPRRGKSVWDREFGSLKAVNFGSRGTHPDSLIWRMQNGELDGYQAKLVVLHAFGDANRPMAPRSRFHDWHAGYAAVIAEIRARQPQAKILIFAALHREQTLREWREVAAANAAVFTDLVDDETVFYDDYGERFYRPDGSFSPDMWRTIEPAPYEMWAEELQPWLDRFVR
jgi:beta-lactamase regulating signal transducer with metallopeptidase domain